MKGLSGIVAVVLLSLLAGCATTSRYSMDQDAAPPGTVDVNNIPPVIPHPIKPAPLGNSSPYTVWGKTYHVLASAKGYHARGTASWYGAKFHGHRTSDGEIFSMYKFTAAHRTLPIPCFVRVTNLRNGRSLIVRVNDRGPFHSHRLIDLSYAAAKKLGFAKQGTAPVEVDAVSVQNAGKKQQPAPLPVASKPQGQLQASSQGGAASATALFVQVAAFTDASAAADLRSRLSSLVSEPVRIEVANGATSVIHRVQVGPFSTQAAADAQRQALEKDGFSQPIVVSRPLSGSG